MPSESKSESWWRLLGFTYEAWRQGYVSAGWAVFSLLLAATIFPLVENVATDVR